MGLVAHWDSRTSHITSLTKFGALFAMVLESVCLAVARLLLPVEQTIESRGKYVHPIIPESDNESTHCVCGQTY